MAEFEVCELQGMRWVQIRLRDETVRAEAGALSYMQGDIRITARLPSVGSALKAIVSDESVVRPSYTGTGIVNLESSMGGYHMFEVAGESWISRERRLLGVGGWGAAGTVPRAGLDLVLGR